MLGPTAQNEMDAESDHVSAIETTVGQMVERTQGLSNMAYVQNTAATGSVTTTLTGFVSAVLERVARYRVYRETMVELSGLSDRELADLGLSRANLRSVSYEAAYGA